MGRRRVKTINRGAYTPAVPGAEVTRLPGRGRFVPRAMFLVLLGPLVAACSGPGPGSPGASTPADGPEPTQWEWVLDQIGPNGEVSRDLALQAFEVAIGDLPGVEPPPGPTGDIEEGTFAVFSILQHWKDITEEQRAAADAYLNRGIEPGPSGAALPLAVVRLPVRPWQQPPSATIDEWIAIKDEAAGFIRNSLVRDAAHTPTIEVVFNAQNEIQQGKDKAYGAIAVPFNSDGGKTGDLARCVIKVNPNTQGYGGDQLRWLVAHEVAHCFSWALRPIESPWLPWLEEGSATWVGYEFIGGSTSYDPAFWTQWLLEPDKRLYSRAYDAVGFFAHIEDSGANPWALRDAMVNQSHILNGPYLVAADAAPDRLLDEWGPGYLRDVNNIPRWETTGLGIPPNVQFEVPVVDLANGGFRTLSVNALAVKPARLNLSADVVQVNANDVHGRIRFANGADYAISDLDGMLLCTRSDGCCPSGDIQIAGGIAQVGLTGHLDGGVVTLLGVEAPCPTPSPTPRATIDAFPATASFSVGGGLSIDLRDGYCELNPSPVGLQWVIWFVQPDRDFFELHLNSYTGPGTYVNPNPGDSRTAPAGVSFDWDGAGGVGLVSTLKLEGEGTHLTYTGPARGFWAGSVNAGAGPKPASGFFDCFGELALPTPAPTP